MPRSIPGAQAAPRAVPVRARAGSPAAACSWAWPDSPRDAAAAVGLPRCIRRVNPWFRVGEREHVVGKGETVYMIAWRHGIDYRALARDNGIREPYTIFPGQRLLIPEPGDAAPPAPGPGTANR